MKVRLPAVLLVVFVLFTGCLSIETHISFEDRESGTITNVYRIDRDYLVDDAVASPSGELPLPASEADARSTARLVDGLSLEAYTRSQDGDREVIEVTFRFASIGALNGVYGAYAGDEPIIFDGDIYRQRISEGVNDAPTDEAAELLGFFVGEDERIHFSVSFADRISAVSEGMVEDDATASVERSLEDLLEESEPVYWEIELE